MDDGFAPLTVREESSHDEPFLSGGRRKRRAVPSLEIRSRGGDCAIAGQEGMEPQERETRRRLLVGSGKAQFAVRLPE